MGAARGFAALLLAGALFWSAGAEASVSHLSKRELIQRAELIAIVDIDQVEKLESERRTGSLRAIATVRSVMKGPQMATVVFSAYSFYPCGVVNLEEGRYLVFLGRSEDSAERWAGVSWSESYRRIRGDLVWWEDDGRHFEAPLWEAIAEITAEIAHPTPDPRASPPRQAPAVSAALSLGKVAVSKGSCRLGLVQRYLEERSSSLRSCYLRELKQSAGLRAKLSLRLEIAESGRATQVQLRDAKIPEPLAACLRAGVRAWVFPVKAGRCAIEVPLELKPAE